MKKLVNKITLEIIITLLNTSSVLSDYNYQNEKLSPPIYLQKGCYLLEQNDSGQIIIINDSNDKEFRYYRDINNDGYVDFKGKGNYLNGKFNLNLRYEKIITGDQESRKMELIQETNCSNQCK